MKTAIHRQVGPARQGELPRVGRARARFVAVPGLIALLLAPLSAQDGRAAWTAWARANHHPIATVLQSDGDRFADLQFFKPILGDRRIVQLGESGHGVAEFNHAKVRLIKFLHQQMGFDVIAFESGLYECYAANDAVARAADLSPTTLMRRCIFGVWHTEEVLPLFEYIKSTQGTSRPLTLAGFDTQISSALGVSSRPAFFAELVRAIEPARATETQNTDQLHITSMYNGNPTNYATTNQARLTAFYGDLELFFQEHRAALAERFGADAPIVAEKAAFSMLRYMEQLRAGVGVNTTDRYASGGAIRDFGMANNLTFLANDLYPGKKIMVWAHNFHIRHDHIATSDWTQPTMGQWVRERFRDQLYTIGLYMNQGTGATNARQVYSIAPGREGSLEWIMSSVNSPVLFMDFLKQERGSGNSWMFEPTSQREWGRDPAFGMVPRNQYDGVLFIETVRSPSYIQF